jgi:excisionase family DNA binding protein
MNKKREKEQLSMEEILKLKYFGVDELSRYLPGKTQGAIRNLVLRRQIPFYKPGGRLLFDREEIDLWVKRAKGISLEDLETR